MEVVYNNQKFHTHRTIVNIYIVYELTLILISIGILVMELDLIENQVFHF